MANFETIKKRIKSVETTAKITFAMKMVATSKLQKFKKSYAIYQDYLQGFYNIFVNVFNDREHDLEATNKILLHDLVHEQTQKTLWVVVGSDIGMCGGFNSALIKKMLPSIQANDAAFFFGTKISSLTQLQLSNLKVMENYNHIEKNLEPMYSFVIAKQIYQTFTKEKFTVLKIVHTKFINSLSFEPVIFQVLPLDKNNYGNVNESFQEVNLNQYELYTSPSELIAQLLPHFFGVLLYGAIIESKVSESSARYNAMLTATDNANALIENYKLEYNRKRQASITQEIIEIVSGSSTSS